MKFLLTLFLFLAAAASLVSADKPLIPFDASISAEQLNDLGELAQLITTGGKVAANGGKIAADGDAPKLPISAECLTTLIGIVAAPDFAECMPIAAFAPLLKLLDPNFVKELLKDPVKVAPPLFGPVFDSWCPAPKCSEKLIGQTIQTIQTGCKADLESPLIKDLLLFFTFYSPIRDSVCFKNGNKEYCVFETLKEVFTLPPPAFPVTKNPLVDSVFLANPVTICTACNKAIVNTLLVYLKSNPAAATVFLKLFKLGDDGLAFIHLGVSTKCGQQFDDGKVGDPTKDGGLCSTSPKQPPTQFAEQLSLPQDVPNPLGSGATSIKGISLLMMMGSFLVSTFFMI